MNKEAVLDEETKLLRPTMKDGEDAMAEAAAGAERIDDWEVLMMARLKCGLWQIELNKGQRMWILEGPLDLARLNRRRFDEDRELAAEGAASKSRQRDPADVADESVTMHGAPEDGCSAAPDGDEPAASLGFPALPGQKGAIGERGPSATQDDEGVGCQRTPSGAANAGRRYRHPKFVIESDEEGPSGSLVYLIEVDADSQRDEVEGLESSLVKYVNCIRTRPFDAGEEAKPSGAAPSATLDGMSPAEGDEAENTADAAAARGSGVRSEGSSGAFHAGVEERQERPFIEDVIPHELATALIDAIEGRRKRSELRIGESLASQITLGADYLSNVLVKVRTQHEKGEEEGWSYVFVSIFFSFE